MTNAEMIEQLKTFPPDAPVYVWMGWGGFWEVTSIGMKKDGTHAAIWCGEMKNDEIAPPWRKE